MSESKSPEAPPRPEEILDEDRIAYQAMSELSDEKYAQLASDIRDRGVLNTILLDEDGAILDGHHREAIAQHYDLDGSRAPTYLRVGDLGSDDEKWARAIKQNLLGRDTTDAVKRHAVENYIKATWGRDEESGALVKRESQSEVAEALGVSNQTVGRVLNNFPAEIIKHERLKAREYYRENPDASYREVSRQVDASNATVTSWLKEDFDEGDDEEDEDEDQEPLNLFAKDEDEDEANEELLEQAQDGDEDAKEQLEKVQSGEKSADDAVDTVEKRQRQREAEEAEEEPVTETPPLPDDTYRGIVIDPPWPMEKIGREERPDQGKYLDYPTMDLGDIRDLPVPELTADEGSHVYLWTTHKYLPAALECFEAWDVRYECLLSWVKPTGMTPFSWQYNTEHVLFGRAGDGLDVDEMGQQLSFEAPVTEHSAKPDVFYERVKEATPGPRLEMFARTARDGFDLWGDEAPDVDGGDADE